MNDDAKAEATCRDMCAEAEGPASCPAMAERCRMFTWQGPRRPHATVRCAPEFILAMRGIFGDDDWFPKGELEG